MKKRSTQGTILTLLVLSVATISSLGWAEELTPAQQEAVKEEVQRILREQGYGGGMTQIADPSSKFGKSTLKNSQKSLEDLSKLRTGETKYGSTMEGSGQLVYARPFVASPKAILGGYMDFEYVNRKGGNSKFDAHRLVPFIYGDISNNVKFAAEIEIEHGGVNDGELIPSTASSTTQTTEVKVEFAVIDYLVNEPINLRAGIILLPLGKFNLLHDSPLRDLTDRPLVAQRIIPTTLHQPGVGVYGTFYPTTLSQLYYEVYITSGFTRAFGGSGNPANPAGGLSNITNTNGLRSARDNSTDFDNNAGKAVVGRVAFSPILGVEFGGSGFLGAYDQNSKRPLAIWALDWTLQRGPFELIGESAWAYIRDNDINAVTGAVAPASARLSRRMQGYYVQLNYHFLPPILAKLAPSHFRPEVSTFTAVVRWEDMNLGQDLAATEAGARGQAQRLTLGLNFRPTEDAVLKLDYQYEPEVLSSRTHGQAFVASVATYF